MKVVGEVLKALVIFGILTILTQVGGIVYLLYKPLGLTVEEKIRRWWVRLPIKVLLFSGLLAATSLWIVPRFATGYGRVPLPLSASEDLPLKPASRWYWLANRHYVKPEMLETITAVSKEINQKYPGTQIIYLDANFPFWDDFPLLPHRSHDDGRKLDVAFLYQDPETGERINGAPTWLGYGFTEGPKAGEYDQISLCEQQGFWQYSLPRRFVFSKNKAGFAFDEPANTALLRFIARQKNVQKIFIEPHLKTRLGLQDYDKIRFHGCQAVRHDDHIHLQTGE